MEELATYGYLGLFISSFLAATILPLSSEVVLSILLKSGLIPFKCLIWASIGNTLGGITCYWIGRAGKIEWMEKYLKISNDKLQRTLSWMSNKGSLFGLLTFLPGIGDVIAVALGYMRCNFWFTTLFMFIGKAIRYYLWINLHFYVFN